MNTREKISFEGSTIGARQVNSSYHQPVPVLGELGTATSSQLSALSPSIMVPLGSVEQHGPHLPLDTDTRIAGAVAAEVTRRIDGTLGPPLAYGASGEHAGFAGTLSMGLDALELVVLELIRSADHFAGVIVVNGHGG